MSLSSPCSNLTNQGKTLNFEGPKGYSVSTHFQNMCKVAQNNHENDCIPLLSPEEHKTVRENKTQHEGRRLDGIRRRPLLPM